LLLGSADAQFPGWFDAYTPVDPRMQLEQEMLQEQLREQAAYENRLLQFTFPYSEMPRGAPLPFQMSLGPALLQMFPYSQSQTDVGSNVAGFGGYPGAGARTEDLVDEPLFLERVPVAPDRWPSWIEGGVGSEVRATPERAVLVRGVDRVWFLDPGEAAFIPLAHYDRFRFLRTGSRVEVRGSGEYEVVMHDSSTVRSLGLSALAVVHMDERELSLQIDVAQQLWLTARSRPMRVRLPDGTLIEFNLGQARLEDRGDRYRLSNEGSSAIAFTGSAGSGELLGAEQMSIWKAPPVADPVPGQLQLRGDTAMVEGSEEVSVRGGADGQVVVSGAVFDLGQGSTMVIRPLGRSRAPE
jgi:hypothetical protein